MKLHRLCLMALSTVPLLAGACADAESEPRGLELAVAPLQLDGIGQACYDIRVSNLTNGTGQTVWSKGTPGHQVPVPASVVDKFKVGDPDAICSGQYGNATGGDITYIGACDADGQANLKPPRTGTTWTTETPIDAEGERINSVTIWFDGLYDAAGLYIVPTGEDGWQDPCGSAGCTLDFICEENADNLVEFNFTVMRDAQQGFFDIAVNFEDIFCSAKFDACLGVKETRDVPPRRTEFDHDGNANTADVDLVLYPYETAGVLATNRNYVFELETVEKGGVYEAAKDGRLKGWYRANAAMVDDGSFKAATDKVFAALPGSSSRQRDQHRRWDHRSGRFSTCRGKSPTSSCSARMVIVSTPRSPP